jgi:L-xylulokinase
LLNRCRPVYAESLLQSLGLGEIVAKLPNIVPSTEEAGAVSAEAAAVTGLRRGTPVASGSHDLSASLIGTAATEDGAVCIIAGTWSIDAALANVGWSKPEGAQRGVHGRWFVDGRRQLLASSSPAGTPLLDRVYWSMTNRKSHDGDHMDGILNRPAVPDLPVIVPSLRGLGRSNDGGASVLGLDARHDAPAIGRALVEAMAFRHRLGCDLLNEQLEVKAVRVTGGLARSQLWTQFLADALDRDVWRPDNPEAGAAGAAAMAGVAAGAWTSVDQAARAVCASGLAFHPRSAPRADIDLRYARYLSAIDRLVPSC